MLLGLPPNPNQPRPVRPPHSILLKNTYTGDATLDGLINADDYFMIDSGFISQAKGYQNRDFNYDGVINADDYFLIDSAYVGQGSSQPMEPPP